MAVVKVKEYNGMEFRDLAITASPVTTEVAVSQYDKIVVEEPLMRAHIGDSSENRDDAWLRHVLRETLRVCTCASVENK
jgi:hypothetical protein